MLPVRNFHDRQYANTHLCLNIAISNCNILKCRKFLIAPPPKGIFYYSGKTRPRPFRATKNPHVPAAKNSANTPKSKIHPILFRRAHSCTLQKNRKYFITCLGKFRARKNAAIHPCYIRMHRSKKDECFPLGGNNFIFCAPAKKSIMFLFCGFCD